MTRISISFRSAICLALLSLCGLLIARVSGLFPDTRKIQLQARTSSFKSLANDCSMLAGKNDLSGIEKKLTLFVHRNKDVLSAAFRRDDGDVLVQVGDHAKHWAGTGDGQPTDAQISVPIAANTKHRGNVEVALQPAASVGMTHWMSPFVEFAVFITAFNALLFLIWLRRALMKVDASRSTPPWADAALHSNTDADDDPALAENVSPMLGEDGNHQGTPASFDDANELEFKKVELIKMLKTLKASREEIQEQNKQLRLLATIDPLTECMNRRSFFPLFDQHWEETQIGNQLLCSFMVDIDHFKSINDDHGHAKGDEVLKGVADCLREEIGDDGLVCRFGGEEFCVLLPECKLEQAVARADQIRIAMSQIDFGGLTITASVGVSSIELGANSPQEMLEQADKCLYVAKRHGRNKVVTYTADMETLQVDESKVRRTRPRQEGESSLTHIPFPAVASLMSALAYRHTETAEHSARVADLCVAVARGLMSVSEAYILEIAALLHDIGKIGVPDAILLKPGELTSEEWRVMKMNERIGVEIVGSAFYYEPLVDVIRFHKAPYDSRNDVTRLPSGDELPLGARILAIADAYDSMVTNRSYRKARSRDEAFSELRRCAGTQFDPRLVERFIEIVADKPQLDQPATGNMSRQTALQMATQIEELARALDEQDVAAIEALAARLRATAACAGATEVETLAGKLSESATSSEDAAEIFELTIELMDLCRSAQRAAVSSTLPASAS